jgi:hypothetical protein
MPKKAATPATPEPAEETGVPIVVRRAMIKDDANSAPATTTETPATEEAGNPIEVKSKKSRIEPLTKAVEEPKQKASATTEETVPAATQTPPTEAVKAAEPLAPAAKPAPPAVTPDKPVENEPKPAEGTSEFTLAGEDSVDTPDDPSQNPIDQAKTKADKEAAEKQAALDKLVDAQTYFLPLNSVEKRRTKQLFFVTMLLLIVLAGAGAFWANGQGYISIPGL